MEHSADKDLGTDYENPPVVETVLGTQFGRMSGFKNAHLGAFWKTLDTDAWPSVSDVPTLPWQYERFTESARWSQGAQFSFSQDPSSRLQIRNRDGDRMIQVQNGRLHFNWLGEGGGEYVRYKSVREGFVRALGQFVEFVTRHEVGDFQPNQWEVTYVNHIPKGTVWRTPDDWGFFRPFGAIPKVERLVQAESFAGEWHFVIPEQRGRLHVRWQHGLKREPNQKEMIILTLTARGPIEEEEVSIPAILAGLDLGRATIVRSFEELMTDAANKYWGLKHAKD